MVDEVLLKRAELQAMIALHDGRPGWATVECDSLKRLFGLGAEDTEASLT